MNQERLFELMNRIDDDLILRAEKATAQTAKRRSIWLRMGVLAACVCLIFSTLFALPMLLGNNPSANIPVWEDALYSAQMMGALFDANQYGSGGTNAYTKVYVPDDAYLYMDDLPSDEYLSVYRYRPSAVPVDKNEFESFLNSVFPRLSESLGVQFSPYELKQDLLSNGLEISQTVGNYIVGAGQNSHHSMVSLIGQSSGDGAIVLDGERVEADQRLTDAQIVSSMESIRSKLLHIFGVSFEDVRVERVYNDWETDASGIYIYFYDEDAHPLNEGDGEPVSDYIRIFLDDPLASDEAIISGRSIVYVKHREEVSKMYSAVTDVKRISLADAETLLYNGYVFGGHACPRCMEAQDRVSFEDYDYVDLEYVFPRAWEKSDLVIPFYAFYKKIGTSDNGNSIYAKTWVPAIEVNGYAEYFNSQMANHK